LSSSVISNQRAALLLHYVLTNGGEEIMSKATHRQSWKVSKFAILRLLGFVYLVAFLGAYYQNPGLMGSKGLQPTDHFFGSSLQSKYTSPWNNFQSRPSIFWWLEHSDETMEYLHLCGISISVLVIIGEDSMILMALLWLMYFSIVTSAEGNSFYSYGWESQLLETGFLGIFLCDIFPRFQFGETVTRSPPSHCILWLFRWLCFRISMGAGLIKIRGDSCWTQKTCLYYHFETQPIPSPMSFFFYFLPKPVLRHAVDLDLFVQVYTSWMVLCPTYIPSSRRLSQFMLNVVRIGGFVQAGFMVNIIMSGNFAFLNHLTIIPAMACLDDACWPNLIRRVALPKTAKTISNERTMAPQNRYSPFFIWSYLREFLNISLLVAILSLSWPVLSNLLQLHGKHQQMNASFGSFRLVNTYGAFGSVGKSRYEPIISITYNGQDWEELEFPCKPGSVTRRPCFCAPYHYRLDWNIWFIGFKPHSEMLQRRESWLFALVAKLLDQNLGEKDRPWLDLLDLTSRRLLRTNYNINNRAPRYVKVDMFHYKMTKPLWSIVSDYLSGETDIVWWNRTYEEELIPPVKLDEEHQQLVRAIIPS
jgi:hypothetical protein